MADSTTAATEDAVRRKEKELARRQEQLDQLQAELQETKKKSDAMLEELEARELVMCDAEEKHGSLLQREETICKREKDVHDKEAALKERLDQLNRREVEQEQHFATKQKEFEEKLFPLAAREQEIMRRESEVKSMEVELESKMRAFAKKVAAEEDKDRAKEKALKEQEAKVKDMLATVEKKQSEADAQMATALEQQKHLKAEQVEVESRDRDLKWRDEQLRMSHAEAHDIKERLMSWEKALSLKQEEQNTLQAKLDTERASLELKELQLSEKTTKLLKVEKDLAAREKSAQQKIDRAKQLQDDADGKTTAAQQQERTIAEQKDDLERVRREVEASRASAANAEKQLQAKIRVVSEKEDAVRAWAAELQFRENTLAKRQAAARVGGLGTAPNITSSFNTGLVEVQLDKAQNTYLGATAKPIGKAGAPVAPRSNESDLIDWAAVREAEGQVMRLERAFEQCAAKFYCMPDDAVREVFSTAEIELIRSTFTGDASASEEHSFLHSVLNGGGEFGGDRDASRFGEGFTASLWQKYYNTLRRLVTERKQTLLATRISKLSEVVELFEKKEESHADLFPPDYRTLLANDKDAKREVKKKGRQPLFPSSSMKKRQSTTATPATENLQRTKLASSEEDKEENVVSDEDPDARPVGERGRLIAALPPYLRKYYDQ